jgi:tetratricopeptide (TPR) repeat protein
MRLRATVAVLLAAAFAARGDAAEPRPLIPPPPDLTAMVPFAKAPLDKPVVVVPEVALPAPPGEVPDIPPLVLAVPAAERPLAFLSAPRGFPCVVKFVGPSQALECGKDKFLKGDYEDAVRALEAAVRSTTSARDGKDREILLQARYWLGESLARLGRTAEADWAFRQMMTGPPRHEYEIWATHADGWMALKLGDPGRASETFKKLGPTGAPASIDAWNRYGLGLALYGLGHYAEARRVWEEASRRGLPPALGRDALLWHGDTLGRVGEYALAETELRRFTQGGPHPLLDAGLLRLGWWALAAGHPAEALPAFRAYLATPRRSADSDWAEAGLVLALAASGDAEGARQAVRPLSARKSPLALPVSLRLVRQAVDEKRPVDGKQPVDEKRAADEKKTDGISAMIQELLATKITPPVRAWLLILNGDADRLAGNRDEARTQYELAQQTDPGSSLGQHARLRLARTNYELREFSEAVTALGALLASPLPADLRAAALALQGEAAYHAGDQATAGAAFRRALVEFPQYPETPAMRLSLGWIALRQNRADEARQLFLDFARAMPENRSAVDALELAAELALAAGEVDTARRELDRIIATNPGHPRADFARLNRAIVMVRSGEVAEAQPALRDWIARAPFPPLVGRAHAALGAALSATNRPADAATEFRAAQREGVDAFATLGLGAAAMGQDRWDEAEKAFTEARDAGTADVSAAAEYGLAAVAFHRGQLKDFKDRAVAALQASPRGPAAPRLLYVLSGILADANDWPGALGYAKRLVNDFSQNETADDALARVGAAAGRAKAWPVAYEAYALLRQRHPTSPFLADSWPTVAEAQIETGHANEAVADLDARVKSSPDDTRAWMLLGRAREAAGDRQAALEAYGRGGREGAAPEVQRDAYLGQARMLVTERKWPEARALLGPLLKSDDQTVATDAAYTIGESYRGEGDNLAAVEYYMTAAYLAPESLAGRRALLAAGQTFAALKQSEAASIVYKKLLAQRDVPSDVADAARQGLASLGR